MSIVHDDAGVQETNDVNRILPKSKQIIYPDLTHQIEVVTTQ